MDWKPVPDAGLYEPQQVRAGNTFGPFRVELADAQLAAYPLTGATLGGDVWARSAPGTLLPLTVAFSDGTNTAVDFYLAQAATAAFTATSFFKGAQSYGYRVWYQTAGGVKKTLVYGSIDTFAGAPTA